MGFHVLKPNEQFMILQWKEGGDDCEQLIQSIETALTQRITNIEVDVGAQPGVLADVASILDKLQMVLKKHKQTLKIRGALIPSVELEEKGVTFIEEKYDFADFLEKGKAEKWPDLDEVFERIRARLAAAIELEEDLKNEAKFYKQYLDN